MLTPTRELALQINEGFATYGRHVAPKCAVIFGGVGQAPQVEALRRNTDIIVATPGRLIDLMEQGHARLEAVETFVLDEADRMLDMGFIQPIRRIVGPCPRQRQNLFFSATMPDEILELANTILVDPVQGRRRARVVDGREGPPVGALRRARQQARAAQGGPAAIPR